jgi:anaerobic glycerol-3-phosphate dehydrogenase
MMRSPIEIELVMAGSVIQSMRRVSPITTLLMTALYVPSTLTLTFEATNPKRSTLLISFDYLPDLISELAILSLQAKLPHTDATTSGENTQE